MADSKKDVSNDVGLALPKSDIGGVPFGLAPRLPITFNRQDGIANIKNYKELAMQNLKMLVLTSPGERVMDPDFGVGLKRFLFQQNVGSTHAEIATRIYNQVQRYLPFLRIEDVLFSGEGPPAF